MWAPTLWAPGLPVQLMGRLQPTSGMGLLWKGRAPVAPSCHKYTRYRRRCEGGCCGVPAVRVPSPGPPRVKRIVEVSSRCLLPMTKSSFWSQKWRIAGSGCQPFFRRPLMPRCCGWGQRCAGRVTSCPGVLGWRRQGCAMPALGRTGGHWSGALCWSNGTRDPWEGADVHPESRVTTEIRRRHRSHCQHRDGEHRASSEMHRQIRVRSCA